MADNLLDKASILLTPTAYNDGRMLSVKPEVAFGEELSTNGDFSNGTTGWSNGSSTLSVVDGKLKILATGAFSYARQNITVVSGKKYKITVNFFYNSLVGNIEVYDGTTNTISEQLSEDGVITLSITPSSTNLRLTLLNRNGVSGDFNYWDNVSVVEDLSGDFTFSRSSAATRVNAQGLVENVQIISSELVSNGNFSQIGTEEVSNGNFSQEGSELVTNGDFATDSDWTKGTGTTISGGNANFVNATGVSLYQYIGTQTGTVKVEFTVTNYTSGTLNVYSGGNQSVGVVNVSANALGTYTAYVVRAGGNNNIIFGSSDNFNGSIDNVSVKEVGQDWSFSSGASLTSLGAKITHTPTAGSVSQPSVLTIGKSYKLTYEITESVSGGLKFNSAVDASMVTTVGVHTKYLEADATTASFSRTSSSNNDVTITNISVKEVGQDWALGTGWSVGDDKAERLVAASSTDIVQASAFPNLTSTFKISFDVVRSAGSVRLRAGTYSLPYVNATDTYTYYVSPVSNDQLKFQADSSFIGSITNISVKEITDDTDLPRINYEGFSYQDSLGSELVSNGGFDTDSNWNKNSNWSISGNTANCDGTSNGDINQGTTLATSGKSYRITFDIVSISQGEFFFKFGGVNGTFRNSIGTYTETIQAINSNRISLDSLNNAIGSIDNVSVKEYLGQEVVPDSGCGSWLLERQSTNLITQSELFSDASWSNTRITITTNTSETLNPSGGNNSELVTQSSTDTNGGAIYKFFSFSATSYTYSIFAKIKDVPFISISETTSAGGTLRRSWFDLQNGTLGSINSAHTAKIESYGNGWYRCSITFTATAGTYSILNYLSNGNNSTTAIVSTGLYIYGAQLEQQSYATSYIPTNGAANTRLQDIATNSGNSTLINSTEGVLYAEIAALANDETERQISIDDGNGSNRIVLRYNSTSNNVNAYLYNSGVQGGEFNHTLSDITSFAKVAFKWKTNDFALWVNGVEVGSDSSGASFLANTLNDISFDFNGLFPFYGKNKALAVYKEALTDANLRSLTYPNPVATTFDLDFDTIAEQFTFTRGSEATFVNAQGLIESTASNDAPRIDYSTGAKAFLLEPQSTNLITYSEDFSNSYWIKNGASVTSGFLSPDGTANAFKLVEDTSTGTHRIRISSLASGAAASKEFTYSFFVKKSEVKWFLLKGVVNTQSLTVDVWFDLENGVVGTESNGVGSIENYGNDWYRCSINIVTNSSATSINLYGYLSDDDNSESYQGDGTSGVYIYGAMLEQQSYSTSYIPTSGASATRNQELCNNATPVINSEEGTLYAEISALADDLSFRVVSISDGTNNNTIKLGYRSDTNAIYVEVKSASVGTAFLVYTTTSITDFHKIAFKYRLNDFSLWIDGVNVLNDSSGSVPVGLSQLSFNRGDVNNSFFGNTKGLKYYPKALADVQLEDLTTI